MKEHYPDIKEAFFLRNAQQARIFQYSTEPEQDTFHATA